jgi:hypothetical protein
MVYVKWVTLIIIFTMMTNMAILLLRVDATNDGVLKIGMLYSSKIEQGHSQYIVSEMVQSWENANGLKQTRGIEMNIIQYDVDDSIEKTINGTLYLIQVMNVSIVVAPERDELILVTASTAKPFGVLVLTGMTGNDRTFITSSIDNPLLFNRRINNNIITTMTPYSYYYGIIYSLLTKKGITTSVANTLAFVSLDDPSYLLITEGSQSDYTDAGLTLVRSLLLNSSLIHSAVDERSLLLDAIINIQLSFPDLDVLAISTTYSCDTLSSVLKELQFSPKAVLIWKCLEDWNTFNQSKKESLRYFYSPVQWISHVRGRRFTDDPQRHYANQFIGTTELAATVQFLDTYINVSQQYYTRSNSNSNSNSNSTSTAISTTPVPSMYAVYYIIISAAYQCNCTDRASLLNFAHRTQYQYSFYGSIVVNEYGMNGKDMIILQVDGTSKLSVKYPLLSTDDSNLIYPAPTWEEQIIHDDAYFANTADITITVIAFGCLLWSIVTFVLMLVNREHPHVRASSLEFSLMLLVGAMMGEISVVTWLQNPNDASCLFRYPLLVYGYVLIQLPIIMKAHRFYKIFQKSSLLAWTRQDTQWMYYTTGLALILLFFYIVIWQSFVGPQSTLQIKDINRPSLSYNVCTNQSVLAGTVFEIITVVIAFLFLVISVLYAYNLSLLEGEITKKRYAGYDTFRETRPITFCVCIQTVLFVIYLVLIYAETSDNREFIITLRNCIAIVLFKTTEMSMCGMRIVDMIFVRYVNRTSSTNSSTTGNNNNNNNNTSSDTNNTKPNTNNNQTKVIGNSIKTHVAGRAVNQYKYQPNSGHYSQSPNNNDYNNNNKSTSSPSAKVNRTMAVNTIITTRNESFVAATPLTSPTAILSTPFIATPELISPTSKTIQSIPSKHEKRRLTSSLNQPLSVVGVSSAALLQTSHENDDTHSAAPTIESMVVPAVTSSITNTMNITTDSSPLYGSSSSSSSSLMAIPTQTLLMTNTQKSDGYNGPGITPLIDNYSIKSS